MIDHKMLFRMMSSCRETVTSTFVAYQRAQNNNIEKGRAGMAAHGYEETTEPGLLTADGREVIEEWGKRWALRPDVHAERLAAAMDAAQRAGQPEPGTKSVLGTESLSNMVCPKCGDSVQHSAVCPKCAAGQLGYRHRYSCVCGGVDLVSKEAL